MAFSKLCERNIKHNKFNSKVDLIILGTLKEQIFQAFTKLALNCVSKSIEDRPTINGSYGKTTYKIASL